MAEIYVPPRGPRNARIIVVGEAPGKSETEWCLEDGTPDPQPFVGGSGLELTRMLGEAGIDRADCFITNVVRYRPPNNKIEEWIDERKTQPPGFVRSPFGDSWVHPYVTQGIGELSREVTEIRPRLIVAMGGTALWGLTGESGITKWRGSVLPCLYGQREEVHEGSVVDNPKVVPTIHPAAILRDWSQRSLVVHDLKRAARELNFPGIRRRPYNFRLRPSFKLVIDTLRWLISLARSGGVRLACDVETSRRQITCFGIAWSKWDAICIPIRSLLPGGDGSYWTLQEELEIVLLLRELCTHPGAQICWQNGDYDKQYCAFNWGFIPNHTQDTMTLQWTMWPGTKKSLEYIGSLYGEDYVYWKDEGKKFDPKKDTEDQYWFYNCEDCSYTWEAGWEKMPPILSSLNYKRTEYGTPIEIQYRMHQHMHEAMLRGVRFDHQGAAGMLFDLGETRARCERWINGAVGRPLNTNSPKQLTELFYSELGFKTIRDPKTKRPTCDAEALEELGKRDLLIRPLCELINSVRQIRNALGFLTKSKDADGRIRCMYGVSGTETFRFNSSEDAFGFGTNLQNITAGTPEADIGKVDIVLPNLRKLFIPDEGYEWGDFDLPQADARVVAWDAEDEELMQMFLDPSVDLHTENAKAIFGPNVTKDSVLHGKLTHRYAAKKGVHATNYLVTAPTLAAHLGITVHDADKFIKRWLGAHPKIGRWHQRIIRELQTRRYIENAFGYRRYYFDRIESIIKEAIAWIPQSTTALTINLGIDKVCRDDGLRRAGVQLLLQVHDSADFQWPIAGGSALRSRVIEAMTVAVPYPKPLIMPPGLKVSTKSWGDCKELKAA